jgi:phosphoribosyl 1,2-cyclic phosphodiesterase
MKLTVLGSSSKGNGYVLHNEKEALLIEAGVPFHEVQKALDFNTCIIEGCVITHEHKDHSKYALKYIQRGIKVFASKGTSEAVGEVGLSKPVEITSKRVFMAGNFKILAFDVVHDCAQPFGYLISHPETGNILFITDSAYSKYVFKNVSHFIVEANYVTEIVQDAINEGKLEPFRLNRLVASHMSLETCKDLLRANDMSKAKNIILIHLSDRNSDAKRINKEISEEFRIPTWIAEPGLTIDLFDYERPDF